MTLYVCMCMYCNCGIYIYIHTYIYIYIHTYNIYIYIHTHTHRQSPQTSVRGVDVEDLKVAMVLDSSLCLLFLFRGSGFEKFTA